MLNKNTKKSTGIEGALFNCMGEMGMDNFGCLKSSLSFFLFLFYNEPAEKIMAYVRLQLNTLSHHSSQCAFSWTKPPPSVHTYFIDDPY